MQRRQRLIGDVEVRFQQQRREWQRFLVVDEPVAGDGVGRQDFGDVVFEQQQFAERVAVLGDGESPHAAVLRSRPRTGDLIAPFDPRESLLAFLGGRLLRVFRRHRSALRLLRDVLPQLHWRSSSFASS